MVFTSHSTDFLYYIGSIFPFSSVIICWICFYSMGHYEKGKVLTISETVCPFPERRIFACTMNAEAWILAVIFFIRLSFIKLRAKKQNINEDCLFKAKMIVLYICAFVTPIGLTVLAAITLDEDATPHLIGAGFFFIGFCIFAIVSDFALTQAKVYVPVYSVVTSWLILGFAVIYMLIGMIANTTALSNTAAVGQYCTAISIFTKVFMFKFDIPKHKVQISSN